MIGRRQQPQEVAAATDGRHDAGGGGGGDADNASASATRDPLVPTTGKKGDRERETPLDEMAPYLAPSQGREVQVVRIHPPGRFLKRDGFLPAYQAALLRRLPSSSSLPATDAVAADPADLFSLAEVPEAEGPVRVDVDLSCASAATAGAEGRRRVLYTHEQVLAVLKAVQEACRLLLVPWNRDGDDAFSDALFGVVLEKPAYRCPVRGVLKNGFHLHLPGVIVDQSVLVETLLPFANRRIAELGVFRPPDAAEGPRPPPLDDAIDIAAARNPWLLYGSCKSGGGGGDGRGSRGGGGPYLVTGLYDHELAPLDAPPASFRVDEKSPSGAGTRARVLEFPRDWPTVLSVHVLDRVAHSKFVLGRTPLVDGLLQRRLEQAARSRAGTNADGDATATTEAFLTRISPYLRLIGRERRSAYVETERDVGRALYHETGGGAAAFDAWREWTGRPLSDEAVREWEGFGGSRPLTAGVIYHHARQSEPALYEEARGGDDRKLLLRALCGTDQSLADLEWHLLGETYVCTNVSKLEGLVYEPPLWRPVTSSHLFCRFLGDPGSRSGTLPGLLRQYQKELDARIVALETAAAGDETAGDDLGGEGEDATGTDTPPASPPPPPPSGRGRKRAPSTVSSSSMGRRPAKRQESAELLRLRGDLDRIGRVLASVGSHARIRSILGLVGHLAFDPKFADSADLHVHLLACRNGVLNLHSGEFSAGRPSDRLTRSVQASYLPDVYSELHPDVVELRNFFGRLLPDPDVREYFMGCCANALYGQNFEKIVVFLTGAGDNGKSVVVRVLATLLGELAFPLNAANFHSDTVKVQSAQPEWYNIRGRRLVYSVEAMGPFKTGLLKRLSGTDVVTARDLHQSTVTFIPQCQVWFACNTLPAIYPMERSVESRIRVIPFESTFVDALDGTEGPNVFLKDGDIESKLSSDALLWILVEYFLAHQKNRVTPRKVVVHSKEYSDENNFYKKFFERFCEAGLGDREPAPYLEDGEAFQAFRKFVSADSGKDADARNIFTAASFRNGFSAAAGTPLVPIPERQGLKGWRGVRMASLYGGPLPAAAAK